MFGHCVRVGFFSRRGLLTMSDHVPFKLRITGILPGFLPWAYKYGRIIVVWAPVLSQTRPPKP